MRLFVLAALCACAPKSDVIRYGGQAPGQTAPAAVDVEAETLKAAFAERERLRARIVEDPVGAFVELGVDERFFEPIAKQLYVAWREKNPPSVARAPESRSLEPPTIPNPLDIKLPIPNPLKAPPLDEQKWWCVSSRILDGCSATKVECESQRAFLGDFDKCDRDVGVYREACLRAQERVNDLKDCKWQERAACFVRKRKLTDTVEAFCSPTIRQCIEARDYTKKQLAADFVVQSNCKPE